MSVKEYPFYLKSTVILFGLILVVYVLSALGSVLVPIAFAAFLAILLNPLCNYLIRHRFSKPMAVLITLLIAIFFLSFIIWLLSTQLYQFTEAFPLLKTKFLSIMDDTTVWIETRFGIAIERQEQFLKKAIESSQGIITAALGTVLGTVNLLFLIPVYIFMLLYYKTLIINFLFEIFSQEQSTRVGEILHATKSAIQSYIVGLLIEMVLVAILNATALFFLGVKYPLLLGFIGAVLNMIPFIGGIVAIALPVLIATVTKDGYTTQLLIIVVYLVIQFIDNNLIFPRFVSLKVEVNALISIIVVFLGGELWGVAGMFLSLPFTAMLKITFDHIDNLKPWGKLLGDEVVVKGAGPIWVRKRKSHTNGQ